MKMQGSIIKYRGELYGFVNQRNGLTAYRGIDDPKKEVTFGQDGKALKKTKKIKHFWNEK